MPPRGWRGSQVGTGCGAVIQLTKDAVDKNWPDVLPTVFRERNEHAAANRVF